MSGRVTPSGSARTGRTAGVAVDPELTRLLQDPFLSKEGRQHLMRLQDVGPKLEGALRTALSAPRLRVAIAPLGPSRKGYADAGSTIQFHVLLLDGIKLDADFEPEVEDPLIDRLHGLFPKDGPQPSGKSVGRIADVTQIASRWQEGREHGPIEDGVTAGYWEHLFGPIAYGHQATVTAARKAVISVLAKEPEADQLWDLVRMEHAKQASLEPREASAHPEVHGWLKKHGVEARQLGDFNQKLRDGRGLPRLADMKQRYGVP